jgi:ABC-type branched-subunit amino acid transport system permease subunit
VRKLSRAAFLAAAASAVVLICGYFVALPQSLWIAALVVLAATALLILVLSFIASRREGESFWRSVRRGSRDAVRWLLEMTP